MRADDLPNELQELASQADQAAATDAARRRRDQRETNRLIGEGKVSLPTLAEVMKLEDMLARCVWIGKGAGVAILPDEEGGPIWALKHNEFVHYFAASRTEVQGEEFDDDAAAKSKKRPKRVPTSQLWLVNPDRPSTYTLTWAPGRERFIHNPKGEPALNTWSRRRIDAPPDWEQRAALFLDHVEYLVPVAEERAKFLDWLAHIEQVPGVLPHHGYLMFTRTFGVGRNWLASALTRVWRGNVAASLDLRALLDGQFNERISQKTLAIVDEIHLGESGNALFALSAKMRQLMTEDRRVINNKYGLQVEEFAASRWLIFSNHEDALPMPEGDRRFAVIANPTAPRSPDCYTRLYNALDDPAFIESVRQALAARDIRQFNPGARPMLNEAKRAVIEATTPELDKDLRAILAEWPSDVVASSDLLLLISGDHDMSRRKHFSFAMRRLGCSVYSGNVGGRLRIDGQQMTIWVLRNHDVVQSLPPEAVRQKLVEYRNSERYRAMLPQF